MIQFNLLPDVKIQYIKANRVKRLVITVSILVVSGCVVALLLLAGGVYGLQRNHIGNLTTDIEQYESDIQNISDINRVLTVQNQLNTINDLHADKPVTSRLFMFLEDVTPSDVRLNRVEVDFTNDTMQLAGQADSLAIVNKFVDTLKFTSYAEVNDSDEQVDPSTVDFMEFLAFNDVVLSSFSRDSSESTFRIELRFDPIIFDSRSEIQLVITERITTRSELDRPQALFQNPEDLLETEGTQ